MNNEARAYFETLPEWMRDSILESGATFETRRDLEEIVRGYSTREE